MTYIITKNKPLFYLSLGLINGTIFFMQIKHSWLVLVLILTVVGGLAYGTWLYLELLKEQETTWQKNSVLADILTEVLREKRMLANSLEMEKGRNDAIESQISGMVGTVSDLTKLSKTDPELLKKYSKIYFLNENYTPESLTKIKEEYLFNPEKPLEIHSQVEPFLNRLMREAKDDGIDLKITSAYRSFDTQESLKSHYKVSYGSGANQFSADQGYSEHQLGTTVDFVSTSATLDGFEKTEAYKWLKSNAHKYGFVISYPEENTYYQFEPWHWRFVGTKLAQKVKEENRYFYSLPQRTIDEYLIYFFD